jgi:hypothetical protein
MQGVRWYRWPIVIAFVFGLTLLSACGEGSTAVPPGGSQPPGGSPPPGSVSGAAQKGPFQAGASVALHRLDATGARTGDSTTAAVLADGSFALATLPWSGITEVVVTGTYFDESAGGFGTDVVSLRALTLAPDGFVSNVNLFTHVMAARVLALLADGSGYADAHDTALADMLDAFGVTRSPNDLDLFGTDAAEEFDNGNLLAFSVVVVLAGLDQADLDALASDFASNGILDDDGLDVLYAVQEAIPADFADVLDAARASLEAAYGATPAAFDYTNPGPISWAGGECDFVGLFSNDLVCGEAYDPVVVSMASDSTHVLRLKVPRTGTYEMLVLYDDFSKSRYVDVFADVDEFGDVKNLISSTTSSGSFAEGLILRRLQPGTTYYLRLRNQAGATDADVWVWRTADGSTTQPLAVRVGTPFDGVAGRYLSATSDLKDSYYVVQGGGSVDVKIEGYACGISPGARLYLYLGKADAPAVAFMSTPVGGSSTEGACSQSASYSVPSGDSLFIRVDNRNDLATIAPVPGGIDYTLTVTNE